jgi:hypothetical protein
VIRGSTSSPVLILVHKRSNAKSVEAWDPRTNKRWTVVDGITDKSIDKHWRGVIAVRNGAAVAWKQQDTLQMVECAEPHRRQSYRLPQIDENNVQLIAITDDNRFALLEHTRFADFPNESGCRHWVIDLSNGSIASQRWWGSILIPLGQPGVYTSFRWAGERKPDEPDKAEWKIDENGMLAKLPPSAVTQLRHNPSTVSPSEKRFITMYYLTTNTVRRGMNAITGSTASLGSIGSEHLVEIKLPNQAEQDWRWYEDESKVVGSDSYGNQYMADASNGEITQAILVDDLHRLRSSRPMLLAILIGIAWLFQSFFEPDRTWALWGMFMSSFCMQWGIVLHCIWTSFYLGEDGPLSGETWIANAAPAKLVGIAGGLVAWTGWYWATGKGWIAARWLLGALVVWIAVLPVEMLPWYGGYTLFGDPLFGFLGILWCIGLLSASTVSAAVLCLQAMSYLWGRRDHDAAKTAEKPRLQFSVSSILLATAAAAILLMLLRWRWNQGWEPNQIVAGCLAGEFICLSIALPFLFRVRNRWQKFAIGIAAFTVVSILVYVDAVNRWPIALHWSNLTFQTRFLGCMSVTLALWCTFLRRRSSATQPVRSDGESAT